MTVYHKTRIYAHAAKGNGSVLKGNARPLLWKRSKTDARPANAGTHLQTKEGIILPVTVTLDCFDPFEIMESGQCFRMIALDANTVEVIAYGKRVTVTALGEKRFVFNCTQATFDSLWRTYFDLGRDYAAIAAAAPREDIFLTKALMRARGLRILRQEPWETLCGFILSQRKNLRAIRTCVEALCEAFGDSVPGTARKSFPTAKKMASLSVAQLGLCGLGYRAPYMLDAACQVASGHINLALLHAMPDEALMAALSTIHGVGIKVANCVMLFAYGRYARAPVDVWIKRVIDEEYEGISPFDGYGEYAGIYQQAMFVFKRDKVIVE